MNIAERDNNGMANNELTNGTPRIVVNPIGSPLKHRDGSKCYGVDVRCDGGGVIVECISTGFQMVAEDALDFSGSPLWRTTSITTLPKGL